MFIPRLLLILLVWLSSPLYSQDGNDAVSDSSADKGKWKHAVSAEFRPARIFMHDPFLKGENQQNKAIRSSGSLHLEYAFSFPEKSRENLIYPDTYQGIGVARFDFGNKKELGNPTSVYFFQRSRIAELSPELSVNYEWNFGLSFGWVPYDFYTNRYNIIIGSRTNAFMNLGFYLKWKILPRMGLTLGADISHFSNGNTSYPNAGLNIAGLKTGLIYDLSAPDTPEPENKKYPPETLMKHFSYDLVAFGSRRKKAVSYNDERVASPETYSVAGAYFATMYNFHHRLRAGISMDFVYDESSDAYTEKYIAGRTRKFYHAEESHQKALGLSARLEYVMPVFDINLGIGTNMLYTGKDMKGTYQTLALKMKASRNAFLHIGYNLKNFREPNYLMLGLGYRFHNKRTSL